MALRHHTLNDGTTLPAIGLGTYGLRGIAGSEGMAAALGEGYRLLDSAVNYENEGAVGRAARRGAGHVQAAGSPPPQGRGDYRH